MQHPTSTSHAELADCLHDLAAFGQIKVPGFDCQIAFEVDVVPETCPEHIYFGLVSIDAAGQSPQGGFAVRLDLASGEVWDALHGNGLIGTLETGPLGLDRHDEEDPLLLSLHIDKHGSNLLPRLRIGGRSILYPTITAAGCECLSAFAGTLQPGRDAAPFCHFPALWMTAAR